jgi:hypothetical protein
MIRGDRHHGLHGTAGFWNCLRLGCRGGLRVAATPPSNIVNTHFLNDEPGMSIDHPALLSLHGVDRKELEALEITEVELAYMVNCIYAGQAFQAAGQRRRVQLGTYRQSMLKNPKFEKAWKQIIRDRLTLRTPFSDAIDKFHQERDRPLGRTGSAT